MAVYQSYTAGTADLYQTITGNGWGAQTFTVSTAHDCGYVDLYVYGASPSSITVSIRDTTTGTPSGVDKASGTMASGDVPSSSGAADWVRCTFSSAYSVAAGSQYAIILRCGSGTIYWSYKFIGAYTGGNKDFSTNSGSTWLGTTPNSDHHFKEGTSGVPTVTTQACTNTIARKSTGHGNITSIGEAAVTQHGHCWATSASPKTTGSKTLNGAKPNLGQFQSALTGLTPGTTYYVAAYATNSEGTGYGDDVTITTGTTIGRRHWWVERDEFHFFGEDGVHYYVKGIKSTTGLPWWYYT